MRFPKSLGHVLWGCKSAKDVQGQDSTRLQKLYQTSLFFLDIWLLLKSILSQVELEEVGYISRLIPQKRNELIVQKGFTHPNAIILKVRSDLQCNKNSMDTHINLDTIPTSNTIYVVK